MPTLKTLCLRKISIFKLLFEIKVETVRIRKIPTFVSMIIKSKITVKNKAKLKLIHECLGNKSFALLITFIYLHFMPQNHFFLSENYLLNIYFLKAFIIRRPLNFSTFK